MPLIREYGLTLIHWSDAADERIWRTLSTHIIERFGSGPFARTDEVVPIFFEALKWMLGQFRDKTASELSSGFYKTLVGLYENTVPLIEHVSDGSGFENISIDDFTQNRSSLRLLIERACELELVRTSDETPIAARRMEKIEELLVIGKWAFTFSELIAMDKLLGEGYEVHVADGLIRLEEPMRFGQVLKHIKQQVQRLMSQALVDTSGAQDLKVALKDCLGVEYDRNAGLVPAYKTIHSSGFPILQDVKYDELIERFAEQSGFPLEGTKTFYAGLTLSITSKESLENIIYKPHSNKRYMNRPVLKWSINGEPRAIVGPQKWAESIVLAITNAVQWATIADEWKANQCLSTFVLRKSDEHDKLLEDPVEQLLKDHGVKYSRNVTRLRAANGAGTSVDEAGLGEIDFLYLNEMTKTLCVVDCKYHRRHSNMVGFSGDYSKFVKDYEPKLKRKVDWYQKNMLLVQEHFAQVYPANPLDLSKYKVEGSFIVNNPTYYSFNGSYRAYSIQEFRELMDGTLKDAIFYIEDGDSVAIIQRPYFQKPIQLDFTGLDLDETPNTK
ncbi:MAG: hypothetical protein IPJ87_02010 [Flavobacteriales bacterium]|nr:hypothetical protein [Flavobacteriales bacterium]MBK8950386.1 hypothetical protein [Flavobacteriales bacterium]MBK9700933.1 hypothetical protein [Flavobacteriales bacterium]